MCLQELKSHHVTFDVPEEYVSRIIGPKGKTIREIRDKHDVQIKMPIANGPNPNQVVVTGQLFLDMRSRLLSL